MTTLTTGQRVAATHPEDRDVLVGCFLEALAGPGVSATTSYRLAMSGHWVVENLTNINLLDMEGINGVLSVMYTERFVEGDAADTVSDEFVGEHDFVNWMLATLNMGGTIQTVEGKTQEVFGVEPEELVGRHLLEFLHPDAFDDSLPMWLGLIEERGATRSSRKPYRRPDGQEHLAGDGVPQPAQPRRHG